MEEENKTEETKADFGGCACAEYMATMGFEFGPDGPCNAEAFGSEQNPCESGTCIPPSHILFAGVSEQDGSENQAAAKAAPDISPADAVAMIQSNGGSDDLVILDVSTAREYLKWHVKGAKNINFFSMRIREKLGKLDRDKTYLVFCKMGGRSKMAQMIMMNLGFGEVYNVAGGRDRWLAEELPLGVGLAKASTNSFCPIRGMMKLMEKLRSSS